MSNLLTWLKPQLTKQWAYPQDYQHGKSLFTKRKVTILEASLERLVSTVNDGWRGTFTVELVAYKQHLGFHCSCRRARKGYFCAHAVAASLAAQKYLREEVLASWRWQLGYLKNKDIFKRKKKAATSRPGKPYWLFVLLSQDSWGDYYLQPRRLWLDKLPPDILESIPSLSPEEFTDLVRHNPWITDYIKSVTHAFSIEGCINATKETAPLVRMLRQHASSRSRSYGYYYSPSSEDALGDLLDLVVVHRLPLVLDDGNGNPKAALTPVRRLRPVLNLRRKEDGLEFALTWMGETPSGETTTIKLESAYIPLTARPPMWVLNDTQLLRIEEAYAREETITYLQELQSAATVPQEELDEFAAEISDLFSFGLEVRSDGLARERVEVEHPVPRLYLSEEEGVLLAKLHFAYGEYAFPYEASLPPQSVTFDPNNWKIVEVVRQPEWEEATYKAVRSARYGLKRSGKEYDDNVLLLRARVDAVDFLIKKVPLLLQEGFEIYGEENLKSVRVNRHRPSLSLNVSSGIDWFDLQAAVKFGETEADWREVRRAIRKKQRYIKLADGTIGEIPEEWVKRYRHLFGMTEETEEGMRMSKEQVVLLDQLLQEIDDFRTDEEFERRRERLRNFSSIKEVPLPAGFVGELRPYQKAGYNWLHFLHEYEFGGCLADDMGLGKTVQVLAFLLSLRENGHAQAADLIVVPRSLLVNWQREAACFTPSLKVVLHFGPARSKEQPAFDDYDLVITTYGTMLRDIEMLQKYRFHYVVLDESQAIKNPLAKTSRAARKLNSEHRLVMTGTPVENTTFELWSQFTFLNPGLLGGLEYFKTEFGTPIEKKQDEEASAFLRRLVYPFILRRTKDQVAPELPPRTERVVYCDMEPAQKKFYHRTRDYYRKQLLSVMETEGMQRARFKILEGLLRLRQICNHPKLVKENFRGDSGKMEVILDTLETLRSEGHKALVFSQFVQMLTLLRRELDKRGIPYEYLDGSTTNRQKHVDHFQEDESIPFFLISLKAGGVGLNLTAADYVLHVDPWWNPAVEMQATDRTHRIGQERPVFVYKFITRDTVEEKILQLQERKKNLVQQLISTESAFFKNLTPEDVQVLFGK